MIALDLMFERDGGSLMAFVILLVFTYAFAIAPALIRPITPAKPRASSVTVLPPRRA